MTAISVPSVLACSVTFALSDTTPSCHQLSYRPTAQNTASAKAGEKVAVGTISRSPVCPRVICRDEATAVPCEAEVAAGSCAHWTARGGRCAKPRLEWGKVSVSSTVPAVGPWQQRDLPYLIWLTRLKARYLTSHTWTSLWYVAMYLLT